MSKPEEGVGMESGQSAGQVARIDFDTPMVEAVRAQGLAAYRAFHEALGQPENVDPSETRNKDYRPNARSVEAERRDALIFLPWPVADMPLRTLVRIAGHLTWGDLEIFFQEPLARNAPFPASQGLRDWYSSYLADFDHCFPEHRLPDIRSGLDPAPPDDADFADAIGVALTRFVSATDKPVGRVALLGLLLRDYASELQPIAYAFGFSIDELMRQAVIGLAAGGPASHAFDYYEELTAAEEVPQGPLGMLAALAIPGLKGLGFKLPENDLLPALRNVAAAEPAEPIVPLTVLGHANSDQPTDSDQIGVAPLVEGLRALLDDERTGLALSIGITAPWGGGKSSVMRQLRAALTRPSLERTREWIPIRFDAWKYERSERLWAALSKAIYDQSLAAMGGWERSKFKFRLEGARRGWFSLLVLPLALTGLLLAGAVVLAEHVSAAAGTLALAATLLGFSGFAATVWGLMADPFKRALAGYTADPAYEEQLGFTADADADIRLLTEMLTASGNRALVVFVDDLDRCSPRHIVEAVEAINQIFNAGEDSRCVFILGMDRDLIAAAIEVAYAETIERLPDARKENFGTHFLAKLVQLSVAVPAPGPEGIERLLDSISEDPSSAALERHRLATEYPSTGSGAHQPPVTIHPAPDLDADGGRDPSVDRAEIDGSSSGFAEPQVEVDEASPEFREAERLAVGHLERNPREVKRFDNAFRLQLQVAQRTPGCELAFDQDDLVAIGSWVAMRLRWPDLAVDIDRDPTLLERLEAAANEKRSAAPSGEEPALTRLLHEPNPARRIARLQDRTFLRIS